MPRRLVALVPLLVACGRGPVAPSPGARDAPPTPASASATPHEGALAADSPLYRYETVKVADGVYAFVVDDPHAALVSSNTLLVIGDDGALVLDTGHFPSLARKMIGDVRALTRVPVRYVVTSHWHPDHLFGNAAFRDAFPGVTFVAHAETRRLALKRDPEQVAAQHDTPKMIARIDHALSTGELHGAPMTVAQRAALTATSAELQATTGDAEVELVPPSLTFDGDGVSIDLGHREVRVMHMGRGNTAGDVMVYVPDANVLATGDVVVAPIPYGHGSYPGEWLAVLQKIDALRPAVILPGHGPIQRNLDYVHALASLLTSIRGQVGDCVKEGLSLDDTKRKVDLEGPRRAFAGDDPLKGLEFDLDFATIVIGRAYEEARGAISDE